MADFDRKQHGVKATRKFYRSGVSVAEKDGRDLTDREVGSLSDDDLATLERQGLVQFTNRASGHRAPSVTVPGAGESEGGESEGGADA